MSLVVENNARLHYGLQLMKATLRICAPELKKKLRQETEYVRVYSGVLEKLGDEVNAEVQYWMGPAWDARDCPIARIICSSVDQEALLLLAVKSLDPIWQAIALANLDEEDVELSRIVTHAPLFKVSGSGVRLDELRSLEDGCLINKARLSKHVGRELKANRRMCNRNYMLASDSMIKEIARETYLHVVQNDTKARALRLQVEENAAIDKAKVSKDENLDFTLKDLQAEKVSIEDEARTYTTSVCNQGKTWRGWVGGQATPILKDAYKNMINHGANSSAQSATQLSAALRSFEAEVSSRYGCVAEFCKVREGTSFFERSVIKSMPDEEIVGWWSPSWSTATWEDLVKGAVLFAVLNGGDAYSRYSDAEKTRCFFFRNREVILEIESSAEHNRGKAGTGTINVLQFTSGKITPVEDIVVPVDWGSVLQIVSDWFEMLCSRKLNLPNTPRFLNLTGLTGLLKAVRNFDPRRFEDDCPTVIVPLRKMSPYDSMTAHLNRVVSGRNSIGTRASIDNIIRGMHVTDKRVSSVWGTFTGGGIDASLARLDSTVLKALSSNSVVSYKWAPISTLRLAAGRASGRGSNVFRSGFFSELSVYMFGRKHLVYGRDMRTEGRSATIFCPGHSLGLTGDVAITDRGKIRIMEWLNANEQLTDQDVERILDLDSEDKNAENEIVEALEAASKNFTELDDLVNEVIFCKAKYTERLTSLDTLSIRRAIMVWLARMGSIEEEGATVREGWFGLAGGRECEGVGLSNDRPMPLAGLNVKEDGGDIFVKMGKYWCMAQRTLDSPGEHLHSARAYKVRDDPESASGWHLYLGDACLANSAAFVNAR